MQVVHTLRLPPEKDDVASTALVAIAALNEMKPQDVFEGHLAAQMVGTHNAAMECLRRTAATDHNMESIEINLRLAAKFLAIYLQQIDCLDRHRGKGTPQVNVGAVNVQAGGQAIVGSVETKPRRKQKSPDRNPAVPALTSSPVTPLDLGPPVAPAGGGGLVKQTASRDSDEPTADP